ncbi:unnamed protein product [Urochloa decumbens]|uniref:Leucine-rich repeat-containing N-terminal plant-type domain-containing protein n=1 Tax=Urochloa decumbens TaxID=240449 RepID=A0ABC8VCA7_9POAL
MAGLLRNLHQHFSVIVHVFLMLLFALPSLTVCAININNPSFTKKSFVDRQALLSFKSQIDDPLGALATWHNDSANFCNWQGITCSKKHANRVIALDLHSKGLVGQIPLSIANLSFLTTIHLSDNHLHSAIPYEIGGLNRLRKLNLSSYSLVAAGKMVPLFAIARYLKPWAWANRFEGPIPASLVNASSLEVLDLGVNSFHGLVPKLGTLAMLKELDIGMNHLEEQDWSSLSSLTNCSNLAKLILDDNKFKGSLPESVGNFTINMNWLWLSKNNFSGIIPSSIGNLKNLTLLYAYQNQLTGSIPSTIGNLHKLGSLSLARNKLTGVIPNSIGNLHQVEELYLDNNELEGQIPSTLEGCKNLPILNLSSNCLNGNIPAELFRLSSLSRGLDLSHNLFSGSIPSQVGTWESYQSWAVISFGKPTIRKSSIFPRTMCAFAIPAIGSELP